MTSLSALEVMARSRVIWPNWREDVAREAREYRIKVEGRIRDLEADLEEARRRRDEWRKRAESVELK